MNIKCNIFKEILKEKGEDGTRRYSQGRVYLFMSILAYYLTLGTLSYKGIHRAEDFDVTVFTNIINALQWAMGLFAGYVFGGKGIEALKMVVGKVAVVTTPVDKQILTEDTNKAEGI